MQSSFECRIPAKNTHRWIREIPATTTDGPKISFKLLILFLLMLYSSELCMHSFLHHRGVVVFTMPFRVKGAVRVAIHDDRRELSECVQAGSLPEDLSRYREQRQLFVARSADSVCVAIPRCGYSLRHHCIEAAVGICKVLDRRTKSLLQDPPGFRQFAKRYIRAFFGKQPVRLRM